MGLSGVYFGLLQFECVGHVIILTVSIPTARGILALGFGNFRTEGLGPASWKSQVAEVDWPAGDFRHLGSGTVVRCMDHGL